MAGGVYKRGSSWYYYFNVCKEEGKYKKVCRKGGATKKEAETSLRKALNEYESTGSIKKDTNISVSDYLKYWLEENVKTNLKYRTYTCYKRVIENHIIPQFGNYKLKNLSALELQEFLNSKKKNGYTKNTLGNFYGVLSGSLKMAVHPYGFIKENPMLYVSMPKFNTKQSDEKISVLTIDEVNQILDRFPFGSSFYINVQIAFHTGLRASEVCSLTWDNIAFENKTLTVEKNLLKQGHEWCFDTPKTKSSNRTIRIGDTLINILKKHNLWQKENQLRYGKYYAKNTYDFHGKTYTTDLISTKENGELVSSDSLKYLSRVVNYDLGIKFNFHALRHTHATMLLEGGANIKDIQKRLGHSKLATTMDTYSHVTEKIQNNTIDIFEKLVVNNKFATN
ncbi:phage integrase [Clostridium botulinum C str. Eklund]|nr:phage integrase [Clostridium botulinum C str. Eklund]NEZ49302.1 site-specific integrase [Clostridium botulinum]